MTRLETLNYELKKMIYVKKEVVNNTMVVYSDLERIESTLIDITLSDLNLCTFIKICTRINKESYESKKGL